MINELIPKGLYCYTADVDQDGFEIWQAGRMRIKLCPFWRLLPNRPKQENGYCLMCHSGDFGEHFGLLWDQVKECSINYEYPEFEELK